MRVVLVPRSVESHPSFSDLIFDLFGSKSSKSADGWFLWWTWFELMIWEKEGAGL
jgi:hypothetical protein